MKHVVAGLTLAALLSPAAPVEARIRVEFELSAAAAMLDVLESSRVDDRDARRVLEDPAYVLLARQIERGEGLEEGEGATRLADAMRAAVAGEPQPGLELEHGRARPDAYRRALSVLRRESAGLERRLSARVKPLLPPGTRFETTLRLVVGGQSVGLSPPETDDVVLRLDDFVRSVRDEPLDLDALAAAAVHEVYHVGFRAAGAPPPRPESPDETWITLAAVYGADTVGEVWRRAREKHWNSSSMNDRFRAWVRPDEWNTAALDRFLSHLSRLQAEGCAVLAEASLDEGEPARDRWMLTIDSDFDVLASLARGLSRGAPPERLDEVAALGFHNNGPLYRVGYRMARRIDERLGRRALLASVEEGPLEFVDRYLDTHPDGPGHVDPATERILRQVIREVRAVGAFDPLD